MADQIEVHVPKALDGERVDRVLAGVLGVSRAVARGLVDEGATVDGVPVKPGTRVETGVVVVCGAPPSTIELQPEEVGFGVLYEDAYLLVVDKPAGVVVHPGHGSTSGTLAAGLLFRYPELAGVGEPGRWGIVHRLDRDTSGVMVVARTSQAHLSLSEMIRRREVARTYITLVDGHFTTPTGTVDAPIGRDLQVPTRRAVVQGGKPARTHYRVTRQYESCTLLSVDLETGRTHQIRVHMAAIDHPVIGDNLYGSRTTSARSPRMFLHSSSIELVHPVSGETLRCTAPMPTDLELVLGSLE